MRIESELLTEGLFGQVLIWMLELVPYLDQLGQKPEWILRSRNYGQPPGFNIFPSIITTTYEPGSESGASAVSFERLLQTVNHDYRGTFILRTDAGRRIFALRATFMSSCEASAVNALLVKPLSAFHYRERTRIHPR